MPIYDYILLALLASGGHRLEDAALTIGPDAITQPKGGGLVKLAAEDIFSKLGDIKGESLDDKHKDEIEVLHKGSQKFNPATRGPLKSSPTTIPHNTLTVHPQNTLTVHPQNNIRVPTINNIRIK